MNDLQFYILGPPRIVLDGIPLVIERRKALALLVFLAVTEQPHTRDALATLFWPELPSDRSRGALRRNLSVLNRNLNGDWLIAEQDQIQFKRRSGFWMDVNDFRRFLSDRHQHGHSEDDICSVCIELLSQAVELYKGDLLQGFSLRDCPSFDDWQYFEAESLRREQARALQKLVQKLSVDGNLEQALEYARRWLALDELNEEAHRHLMWLYAASGQQSASIRQYQECMYILDKALGITPHPETTGLYELIKERREPTSIWTPPPLPKTYITSQSTYDLPIPATPLLDREDELSDLSDLLANPACRLLTIVGMSGIGKTKLALHLASSRKEQFEQGVFFIPLGGISSPENIAPTIAQQIGLHFHGSQPVEEQLTHYLHSKEILLILDNFEHLIGGANFVAELLSKTVKLKIVATSHNPLGLQAEWLFNLGGLAFPEANDDQDFESYPAVELFLQSAHQVAPSFKPQQDDLRSIARICKLVDGMPLGLELAGSRIKILSCEEIATEIRDSLDFLSTDLVDIPERHRSIRAVFDRSWETLSSQEQEVLMRLSVFRGGCTRQAAERICNATLGTLTDLVRKNFVHRDLASGRYDVHALVRQYAEEKMAITGRAKEVENLHGDYYSSALNQREADLRGRSQLQAIQDIIKDFENVRIAWYRAIDGGRDSLVYQMLDALYTFGGLAGRASEIADMLVYASRVFDRGPESEPLRLWGALVSRCEYILTNLRKAVGARSKVEKALELARRFKDRYETAMALYTLAYVAIYESDIAYAVDCLDEGLTLFRELGETFQLARALRTRGFCASALGKPNEESIFTRQSLGLCRQIGDKMGLSAALESMASTATYVGDFESAERYSGEAYSIRREVGNQAELAFTLVSLAEYAFYRGDLKRARELLDEGLGYAVAVNSQDSISYGSCLLGFVTCLEGNYLEAIDLCENARSLMAWNPLSQWMSDWGVGLASFGLNDYQNAVEKISSALELSFEVDVPYAKASTLPLLALVKARQGKKIQAAETMALAWNHPANPHGWMRRSSLLNALEHDLEASLSPDVILTAKERGRSLDLDQVIREFIKETK